MLFRSYKQFGDSIFAKNKYGSYCIPASASHRPAAATTMHGDVWEEKTLEFMLANAKGAAVITAGAFFGDALPALSKVCKEVFAFEPNPESYRCAQITVLMNGLKNVTLCGYGLGEKSEAKNLVVKGHDGRSLGGGSQMADITDRGSESVPVEVVAIDEAIPRDADISIIHLDVEGYEEYALRGAAKTLARCRPLLILETVPENTKGYSVDRQIEHQSYLLRPSPL
jgi:FkbM family methyltransferase